MSILFSDVFVARDHATSSLYACAAAFFPPSFGSARAAFFAAFALSSTPWLKLKLSLYLASFSSLRFCHALASAPVPLALVALLTFVAPLAVGAAPACGGGAAASASIAGDAFFAEPSAASALSGVPFAASFPSPSGRRCFSTTPRRSRSMTRLSVCAATCAFFMKSLCAKGFNAGFAIA